MELKRICRSRYGNVKKVLIVPSGIETCFTDFPVCFLILVLIVPSGIETEQMVGETSEYSVLIVPSGIETKPIRWR